MRRSPNCLRKKAYENTQLLPKSSSKFGKEATESIDVCMLVG